MLEALSFTGEAGTVAVLLWALRSFLNERIVTGHRFRAMRDERDFWRARALDGEEGPKADDA